MLKVIVFVTSLFYSFLVYGLGTGISFNSAEYRDGNVYINYDFGFSGKRSLVDDDGHGSLVALLGIMKQKYFADGSPQGNESVKGWASDGYREAFIRSFRKLKKFYKDNNVCPGQGFDEVCFKLDTILSRLENVKGDISYSTLFGISDFLRILDTSQLQHTYSFVNVTEGSVFPEKKKVTYMLSTDNMTSWIPDVPSASRCKDYYAEGEDFVKQLNRAHAGVPSQDPVDAEPNANAGRSID